MTTNLQTPTGEIVNQLSRCARLAARVASLLACVAIGGTPVLGGTTDEIAFGQIVAGSLTGPGQTNHYSLTASPGDVGNFALVRTGGGHWPVLQLFDGTNLLFSSASTWYYAYKEGIILTNGGRYLLAVFDDGLAEAIDYTLTVFRVNGGNLTETNDANHVTELIVPGQIVQGHIALADTDRYTFTANAGDVMNFALVRPTGGNWPVLQLYDAASRLLFSEASAYYYAYVEGFRLTDGGTYTLLVRDDGIYEEFDYTLTVFRVNGGNLTETNDANHVTELIVPGQIVQGHIALADTDRYTFTANAGDVMNFALVRPTGGNWPVLQLYDAASRLLFSEASAYYYAYVEGFRLTNGGTYTLLVRDDGIYEEFDYTLCVVKIPGPNFPETGEGSEHLRIGESRVAAIALGDLDAYRFPVIAGDMVTLRMSRLAGPGGNLVMQLYGPDGAVAATGVGGDRATIRIACAEQSGNYTLVCRNARLYEAFEYGLTLWQNPGPPPSWDPDQPYLAMFRCLTNTVVRWPTNAAGFQLQFSESLCAPNAGGECRGSWSTLPPPYAVIGDHYFVTNRNPNPQGYFRLTR